TRSGWSIQLMSSGVSDVTSGSATVTDPVTTAVDHDRGRVRRHRSLLAPPCPKLSRTPRRRSARPLPHRRSARPLPPQTISQSGRSSNTPVYRHPDGLFRPDYQQSLLGPGDSRVEQFAGKQPGGRWGQQESDVVELGSLALVNGHGVYGLNVS